MLPKPAESFQTLAQTCLPVTLDRTHGSCLDQAVPVSHKAQSRTPAREGVSDRILCEDSYQNQVQEQTATIVGSIKSWKPAAGPRNTPLTCSEDLSETAEAAGSYKILPGSCNTASSPHKFHWKRFRFREAVDSVLLDSVGFMGNYVKISFRSHFR